MFHSKRLIIQLTLKSDTGIEKKSLFRYRYLSSLQSDVEGSDIMAQSDIANHGYRTECPPILESIGNISR
jgi:hypothetical protein